MKTMVRLCERYDIDVPWKSPITEEQKNQLIVDSGILESEDYNEEDFNLFKFYISPDTGWQVQIYV